MFELLNILLKSGTKEEKKCRNESNASIWLHMSFAKLKKADKPEMS